MWKIRFIVGSFLVSSAVCGDFAFDIPVELREHAEKLHNHCKDKTNVDEEIIFQSYGDNLPADRNLQCYIDCLFREAGLIDKHGALHLEYIIEILPTELQELVEAVTSKCKTVHGKDACETAWLTVKCYFEADPRHAMLI